MADPKGTYYSPNERGFATILPAGPNFLGYAMQMQNQKLRQEQKAAEDQARKDAARERSINQIYTQLSRPNPTDQFYQQDVTEMKNKGLDRMVELDISGADASVIHREAAQLLQELDGYSKAGTQVAGIISGQVKLLRKDLQFKADEIGEYLTGKLVDGEGKKMDPQTLDTNELAWEKAVYGQGLEGAKFLNEGAVVDNFANSDSVKAQNIKWESEPTQTTIGGVPNMSNVAYSQKNKPFLKLSSFDNVGGAKFEILSPEELIRSGVYQLALNHKPMSLLVKSKAEKFFEGRSVPPTDAERDYEEARALNVLLTGQTGGASYGENLQTKRNTPPGTGGGGRPTQGDKNYATYMTGTDNLIADATSKDAKKVNEALLFFTKDLGIGANSMNLLSEFAEIDPRMEMVPGSATFNPPAGAFPMGKPKGNLIFVQFKFPGSTDAVWEALDQDKFNSELVRGGAYDLQDNLNYGYKVGGKQTAAPANPNAKGYDIFKNKK